MPMQGGGTEIFIMRKKERAELIVSELKQLYPHVRCSLNYSTPLQMLIATQLSAQCTDARVNIVTEELFKKYKTRRQSGAGTSYG